MRFERIHSIRKRFILHFFGALIFLSYHILVSSPALAQSTSEQFLSAHSDFFRVFMPGNTEIDLNYQYQPGIKANEGEGEYDLHKFVLDADLPYPISRDTFYRLGFTYGARLYEFEEVALTRVDLSNETLHRVEFKPGIGVFLSDDLLFNTKARLGVFSNFSGGVDEDHIQLLGDAMFVLRFNPGTQLLAGAALSEDFGDTDVIPLVGLRILSGTGRFLLNITAPLEAKLTYRLSSDFEVYGGGWISGEHYNVEIDNQEFDIQIQENRVGGGLNYWLGKHLRLAAEIGVLIGSEFEVKLPFAGQFEDDLEPGVYLSVGVGVSL